MAATPFQLREFRLLWVGGLFVGLGAQMSALALPLLVLRQTGSPVQAAAIGTVSMAALLVTMVPGGALADTVERRRLMLLCDLGSLGVVCALTIAVANGTAPMALVLGVAGAGAVLGSLYMPAALGLLRAVVPADMVGAAASQMQARGAVARLAGPLIGGVLFAWHPAAPFAAEAVGLLLSALCLALMRTRSRPQRRAGRAFRPRELAAGVMFLWHRPYLRTVLLVFGLGMNAAFNAMMFTAFAIASAGGHSGLGGGTMVSLAAAGTLLGALAAPRLRPEQRPRILIVATCWTCVAAVAVMALWQQPLVMGLLAAACLCMGSVANVGFLATLLVATPEDKVGRVQSAAGLLSSLVQPLAPVAAGAMLGLWGATATFGWLTAAFAVCAIVISWAPSARMPADEHVHDAPSTWRAKSPTVEGSS
jgi:MFS family permease